MEGPNFTAEKPLDGSGSKGESRGKGRRRAESLSFTALKNLP
jgi:hypothetical protein